jgi:hypothetical protein
VEAITLPAKGADRPRCSAATTVTEDTRDAATGPAEPRHRLPDVSTDLTRRDLLRLGLVVSAAAGLAACTTSPAGTPKPTDPGGPEDPDRALRAEVGADEARLSALYARATGVLQGAASTRIAAIGARHEAYRTAVDPAGLAGATGASGATGPSASPTTTIPTTLTAVSVLVAAETAAAAERARQAAAAVDPELARVLALVGAGEAAAAAALASARAR